MDRDAVPFPDAPAMDDALVIEQVRAGDERAFERLFRLCYALLVLFAKQLVRSADIADEVVADVFLSLWTRHEVWDPAGSVMAYLYRAVRNRALNSLRDTRTAEHYLRLATSETTPGMGEGEVPPDVALESSERESGLWAAIGTLPERSQTLLELRWRAGLTPAEIAATLDMSVGAVNTGLSRATKALQAALPDDFR